MKFRFLIICTFLPGLLGPINNANAFFGIGDCYNAKSQIRTLENRIIKNLAYLRGLPTSGVSVNGPQGVKVYVFVKQIASNLSKIQRVGKKYIKCFGIYEKEKIKDSRYWQSKVYVILRYNQFDESYQITAYHYDYLL